MSKNKSPFPSWLPFITIPLIFIVSRTINNNRNVPIQRNIPQQQRSVDVLGATCMQCRMMGDCSAFPFCTKSQRTCEWKQNWDGNWVQECRSF